MLDGDLGLDALEKELIVREAHRCVETSVRGGAASCAAAGRSALPGALLVFRGVFVALYRQGLLRGCMGTIEPVLPLVDACRECAIAAALKDPRFASVVEDELPGMVVEVTVTGGMRPLGETDALEGGSTGVVLSRGCRREVFLPGVLRRAPSGAGALMAFLREKAQMGAGGDDGPESWCAFDALVMRGRQGA
jgi:uncharacterized protein (TIGR00296 family)